MLFNFNELAMLDVGMLKRRYTIKTGLILWRGLDYNSDRLVEEGGDE